MTELEEYLAEFPDYTAEGQPLRDPVRMLRALRQAEDQFAAYANRVHLLEDTMRRPEQALEAPDKPLLARKYLQARMPGADIDQIRLDWNDLLNAGMVTSIPTGVTATPKPVLVAATLRAHGRAFAEFVEAGTDEDAGE